MLKVRIIPVLSFNGLALVKTKQFADPRMVGNPIQAARVYNSRGVDELIFLDIFASRQHRKMNVQLVEKVLRECFIPLGVGGAIDSLDDISALMKAGADKVVLKTVAMQNPAFVTAAARTFGAQAICIAVDAVPDGVGGYRTWHPGLPGEPVQDYVRRMQDAGAGEFVVNAVQHDGMMQGFDVELMRQVTALTRLPVIACGGAGTPEHFVELFTGSTVEAAAAASIYHFTQFTPQDIKLALRDAGKPVRLQPPSSASSL